MGISKATEAKMMKEYYVRQFKLRIEQAKMKIEMKQARQGKYLEKIRRKNGGRL